MARKLFFLRQGYNQDKVGQTGDILSILLQRHACCLSKGERSFQL